MDSKNTKDGWDRETSIAQIFGQMFSGSLVAGALVGIPVVFIVALMWLGEFLPEESKLADDPTPDSFVSSEN
jgi:H+/gluconate symporter-like permease